MQIDSARELKARLGARLAGWPAPVSASGLAPGRVWFPPALGLSPLAGGRARLAIRVATPADAATLLEGVADAVRAEVDVRVIGPVRAQTSSPSAPAVPPADLQRRVRPLRPGLSVAHPAVTAGTLGGVVRMGGRPAILSNNHVLAASDAASVGDPVLQPGPADGGTGADRVATLSAFVRFTAGRNLVDAAVAVLDPGVEADPAGYPGGPLAAVVADGDEVDPDEAVEKVGRTTGHTRGRITAVEVDGVAVQYDDVVHTFDGQIEIEGVGGAFSAGGDSGSVIWRSGDRAPLALLFAGSDVGGAQGGGVTFASPLATVLAALGAEW
ncbi:hypothetical protein [Trujillonella endophytica]|uniref:Trypsin-like peptidase domain-containing protein n=1 Tax=Trujillonella endophytica TaxID=673521 RepID=A0A1H8RLL9_9ACTN|nr:hypothetical protein [Trujillella endophytica]SEO67232.1 hypothetical protein SAMN05660991_01191 [Trujillella endophytica]